MKPKLRKIDALILVFIIIVAGAVILFKTDFIDQEEEKDTIFELPEEPIPPPPTPPSPPPSPPATWYRYPSSSTRAR